MTEAVATRYAGARVPRVEDARLLTGHGTFVDDVVAPGHAARLLRAQPLCPGPHRRHRQLGGAGAAGRARRVRRRRPEPGRARGLARGHRQGHRRTRRGRRWPRARRASSAIRSRSSSPTAGTSPRTRSSSSTSTTSRCRPSSTSLKAVGLRTVRRPRGVPRQRRWRIGSCASSTRRRSPRPRTSTSETIYQQVYARGADGDARHRRRVAGRLAAS